MDIKSLIDALGRPGAYGHPVADVEIRQTHISIVALAGHFVYKVKKSVDLGFLDFTTLDKRLHFCQEEVRLNRRLAPDVYLGVVPLVQSPSGELTVGGTGSPVEFAVKMRRLPDEATLRRRLEREQLDGAVMSELGRRIALFHATAASGPHIDRYGCWDTVAQNARENIEQSRAHVGTCVRATVLDRLETVLEERLGALRPLIERRAASHVPRDTHGDLHLDHVYLFPDEPPPRDLIAIDCIEFNERFRYADPVADMAFLAMDLYFLGRRDLAKPYVDAYFDASADAAGRPLLPFYVAYRSAVRAKVKGIVAAEPEVPAEVRREAIQRARGHWLLALSELEDPDRRPGLVLIGGLPGSGKSTLAERLGAEAGFEVVSSDRVRKSLAGLSPDASARAAFGAGIYTAEWNRRTYAACFDQARALLFQGKRVIIDASFREARRRREGLEQALRMGVRGGFLGCVAPPDTIRSRLGSRRGGASDADWAIYQAAADAWEEDDPPDPRFPGREVFSGGTREEAFAIAVAHLGDFGLRGKPHRR
ncbi:MAG: AAA family ATPase [Gemmatimonadota bacterium]|nr:AAA family ATPase [Gemmatimonadota bacterium]